jgi:DNA invertase Pin-like site-specific DNA recombinase
MGRPRKRQTVSENRSDLIICYVRVSTTKQAKSGLGLEAQESALRAELERLGVDPNDGARVLWLVEDGKSAKQGADRPKLRHARHLLATGQAGVILATKVDRLSRSITDFIELVDASQREGWRLVVTGMQLDTSTAMGRFAARIMAEVAELERELIAERTSEALQVKKAQGTRLGPPERVRIPTPVVERIRTRRAEGATYTAICRELEAAGIPTARGASTWYPSTIQQVLDRARSTATR